MTPTGGGLAARPWQIERSTGEAGAFHDRPLPDPAQRAVWLFEVSRPALVLGSSHRLAASHRPPPDTALAAARGITVVTRHSGGAAVLLEPDAVVWVDVILPRDDPLWEDDAGRAGWWVGGWWQRALATLGLSAAVHQGPMRHTAWSADLCFAGVGPGEVLVGGRKVVGLSQRRTRQAARFQTAALLRWDPALSAALCGVAPLGTPLDAGLIGAAAGMADLDPSITAARVRGALIDALG